MLYRSRYIVLNELELQQGTDQKLCPGPHACE